MDTSSFPHFGQHNGLYDIFSQPPLEDFLRIEPLLANCVLWICDVDSGFGFFAFFVHLGFCLGGGFFGPGCFQLVSCLFFVVFRLCGFWEGVWWLWNENGNFQANMRG